MNNKNISKLLIVALTSFMVMGCQNNNDKNNSSNNSPSVSKTSGNENNSDDITGKIVEDIVIKTTPKTNYVLGEEFSIEGGFIELQFEDGTTADLPFSHSSVNVSAPDMTTVGTKSVTVEYDGFTAQYQITIKKQSYYVTLDLNYEGAVNPSPLEVVAGEYANRPANPTRDDYRFVNWCTDKQGLNEFDFATTAINDNITLYANWEQEFAVYFDLDDGSAKTKVAATLNQPIMFTAAPSVLREGYQFLGWYLGDTLYDFTIPVSAAINLKAHWKAIAANKQAHTVTINLNAGEAYPSISYYVEDGSTTFTPSSPIIEGKEFIGWYQAAQGNEQFDFSAAITEDKTIYAHYRVDFYTINFKYVANDEEVTFRSKTVEPGKKVTAVIQKPRVDGYQFDGQWYSDKACTTIFDFNQEIYGDYDLYTKALKRYNFEAEYTYIDDNKQGVGSSDSFVGLKLIYEDNGTAGASNGYWVSGLYNNGSFVEFVINSQKDFDDGILEMNFSSEWADIFIAPQNTEFGGQKFHAVEIASYKALVDESNNPKKDGVGYVLFDAATKQTVNYDPIALTGAIPFAVSAYDKRPFETFVLTTHFALHAGYNVIRLTVNNSVSPYDGTMNAHAPMVDNLAIYTDSVLTWNPHEENVADWQAINFAPSNHGL